MAVLVLGLVAAQSMQREHVIEVVQAKAAITEAQNEVSPAIEDTKKVESETEAKVEENVEPANPFARPEDIKNSKPPMNYEEIFDMKNGEAYPEVTVHQYSPAKALNSREKETTKAILATKTKDHQESMMTKKTWDSIAV